MATPISSSLPPLQLAQAAPQTPAPKPDPLKPQPAPNVSSVTTGPKPAAHWLEFEKKLWEHTGDPEKQKQWQAEIYDHISRFPNPAERAAAQFLLMLIFLGKEPAKEFLDRNTVEIRPGSLWHKRLTKLVERVFDLKVADQKIKEAEPSLSTLSLVDPDSDKRSRFPDVAFIRRKNLELSLDYFKRTYLNRTVPDQEILKFGYRDYPIQNVNLLIAGVNRRLFALGSPHVFHFDVQAVAHPGQGFQLTFTNINYGKNGHFYEIPVQRLYDYDAGSVTPKEKPLIVEGSGKDFPPFAGMTISPGEALTYVHRGANAARTDFYWDKPLPMERAVYRYGDQRFTLRDLIRNVDRQFRAVCKNEREKFHQLHKEFTLWHEGHHHSQFAGLPPTVVFAFAITGEAQITSDAPICQALELLSNLAFFSRLLADGDANHRDGMALMRLLMDSGAWFAAPKPGHLMANAKNIGGLILLKNARVESDQLTFNYAACMQDLHEVERAVQQFLTEIDARILWPHVARYMVSRKYIPEQSTDAERIQAAKAFIEMQTTAGQNSGASREVTAANLWTIIFLDMNLNGENAAMQNSTLAEIPALHRAVAAALGFQARNRDELIQAAMQQLWKNTGRK